MAQEEKSPDGFGMETILEGVLEALENNPELAELAGKMAGMELPFQKPATSGEERNAGDSGAKAEALFIALKPYMNDTRRENVDRLLKLLPTAKTIRTMLHTLGNLT